VLIHCRPDGSDHKGAMSQHPQWMRNDIALYFLDAVCCVSWFFTVMKFAPTLVYNVHEYSTCILKTLCVHISAISFFCKTGPRYLIILMYICLHTLLPPEHVFFRRDYFSVGLPVAELLNTGK
jgi:hypothetical protein